MVDREQIFDTLQRVWGYRSFRAGQSEVIDNLLAGNDTLALMPTGAGKSLLYQLPTLVSEGLCVVVTPLISLMKDQVDQLRNRGINAIAVHSGLTPRQIDIALDNCVYGDVKFLYIAPERIGSDIFMLRAPKMQIALIAVDEAHCISQWGYDFRPSYLRIARLRDLTPATPVLALTASATERVIDDIVERLKFARRNVVRTDFARPNLSFAVRKSDDKMGQLLRVQANVEGSGIVYVRTREGTESVCHNLREQGIAAQYYHAGLPSVERAIRQDEWMSGKARIMVATNAFGMGINKPDVRFVVHYDVCDSLEAYYQEAGRAGRDGLRSFALLLVGSNERSSALKRFNSEFPSIDYIKQCYSKACNAVGVGYGDGKFASFAFDLDSFCREHKLWRNTVKNAMNILQQNGYMTLTDENQNSARLMFCVSRDDLYAYRVERNESDAVLRAILRLYEGVFTDFRPVDTQQIALYSGFSEQIVREQLKQLWRHHIIRYVPSNRSPLLFLSEERLHEQDLYINPKTYHLRREMSAERLERVFDYIDTEGCRSVVLQNYFGQTDAVDCNCCDNCIDRRKSGRSNPSQAAAADAPTECKGNDQTVDGRGVEKGRIETEIVEIVDSESLTVKELVMRFRTDPDNVLKALDALTDCSVVSVGVDGRLRRIK